MNKLEQLQEAIDAVPDEYNIVRNVMTNLLNQGALQTLRDYSLGALDMARHLTSEDSLLDTLRLLRALLK